MTDASAGQNLMVLIDGQSYAVTELPPTDSPIVVKARDEILGGLKLSEMIPELARSRGLLDLAYSGVACDLSLGLHPAIRKIQDELGQVCREASRVIYDLSLNAGDILSSLKLSFSHLFAGRETITVSMLSKCSVYAKSMADDAGKLAERFQAVGDNTAAVLGEVQNKQSIRAELREKIRKDQAELQTKAKETKVLLDELAASKIELEAQYKEAKEEAEKHEGRAFGLAIVGAIFTPLAQGLGAFAGSMTGGGTGNKNKDVPPPLPPKPKAATPAPKPTTSGGKPDPTANPADKDPKTAGTAGPKTGSTAKPDPTKPVASAPGDSTAASAAEVGAKPAASDNRPSNATIKTVAQTAANTAGEVGDASQQASDGYGEIAQNYHKQKMFFLEKLQEAKKAEREAMAAVVGYAEKMKNLKSDGEVNECVLESLHQAVGALQRVVVVLRQSEHFWRRMATSFERLANSEIKSQIELYKAEISDPRERIALYLETDFKLQLLSYLAGWQALQLVAQEYSAACQSIAAGIDKDYIKNLSEKEHMAAIPLMAEALLADARPKLKLLEAEEKELKAEVVALPKAA